MVVCVGDYFCSSLGLTSPPLASMVVEALSLSMPSAVMSPPPLPEAAELVVGYLSLEVGSQPTEVGVASESMDGRWGTMGLFGE